MATNTNPGEIVVGEDVDLFVLLMAVIPHDVTINFV